MKKHAVARWWFVPLLFLPLSCITFAAIEETNGALSDLVLPPEASAFQEFALVQEGRDLVAGDWAIRFQTRIPGDPDFWEAVLTQLIAQETVRRVIDRYEVTDQGAVWMTLETLHDLTVHKDSSSEWSSASHHLRWTRGKAVGLVDDKHALTDDTYLSVKLDSPITVRNYFNGVPRRGGWSDLFRNPTAFVVMKGKTPVAFLTRRGSPRLLLAPGTPELLKDRATALLFAALLDRDYQADITAFHL